MSWWSFSDRCAWTKQPWIVNSFETRHPKSGHWRSVATGSFGRLYITEKTFYTKQRWQDMKILVTQTELLEQDSGYSCCGVASGSRRGDRTEGECFANTKEKKRKRILCLLKHPWVKSDYWKFLRMFQISRLSYLRTERGDRKVPLMVGAAPPTAWSRWSGEVAFLIFGILTELIHTGTFNGICTRF